MSKNINCYQSPFGQRETYFNVYVTAINLPVSALLPADEWLVVCDLGERS